MHGSVGAVLHHSRADPSTKPSGAHGFSSDTHGFTISANKGEPQKSRAVTPQLCRTSTYNISAPNVPSFSRNYLSGFVELLLQPRHRHDCDSGLMLQVRAETADSWWRSLRAWLSPVYAGPLQKEVLCVGGRVKPWSGYWTASPHVLKTALTSQPARVKAVGSSSRRN